MTGVGRASLLLQVQGQEGSADPASLLLEPLPAGWGLRGRRRPDAQEEKEIRPRWAPAEPGTGEAPAG